MQLLAYVIAGTGGLVGLLIHLLVIVIIFALVWWILTLIPLPAPIGQVVRVIFAVICALILIFFLLGIAGCSTTNKPLTTQQQAGLQTASNLARIAVEATGAYYGGPAGSQLASVGLDGAASVLQGYVGNTIPPQVLSASPGVQGVGTVLVQQIAPNHVVKQSDVNRINQAAAIAATLKPAIAAPTQQSP